MSARIEDGSTFEATSDARGFPRIKAHAPDLSTLFMAAARGVLSLLPHPTASAYAPQSITIFCESADLDLLLSDWINSLLYEMRENKILITQMQIEVSGINVKGAITGFKYQRQMGPIPKPFYGVAFTELAVVETPQGFDCSFVMDDPRHFLIFG